MTFESAPDLLSLAKVTIMASLAGDAVFELLSERDRVGTFIGTRITRYM